MEDVDSFGYEVDFPFWNNYHLSSKLFKGQRWISIQKKADNIILKGQCIFLPSSVWNILMLKLEKICKVLEIQSEEEKSAAAAAGVPAPGRKLGQPFRSRKRLVFDPPTLFIVLFQFEILNDEGVVLKRSLEPCLDRDMCVEEAQVWLNSEGQKLKGGSQVVIKSKNAPVPSPQEVMKIIFLLHVLKRVEDKALKDCNGCIFEAAAQKHHMGWGECAAPLEQKVQLYFGHILGEISPFQLSQEFDRMWAKLGLSPLHSLGVAKSAKDFLEEWNILEMIETKFLESSQNIRQICKLQQHLMNFDN
jgi:hypothetical protein